MSLRSLIAIFSAVFFCLTIPGTQLAAKTVSLPFGERVVVVEVPSGCELTESRKESYECRIHTSRNTPGGSHEERTQIVVAAEEVNSEEILAFGEASTSY